MLSYAYLWEVEHCKDTTCIILFVSIESFTCSIAAWLPIWRIEMLKIEGRAPMGGKLATVRGISAVVLKGMRTLQDYI